MFTPHTESTELTVPLDNEGITPTAAEKYVELVERERQAPKVSSSFTYLA